MLRLFLMEPGTILHSSENIKVTIEKMVEVSSILDQTCCIGFILYFVSVITVFIKIYYSVILNLPFSLWNLPFFYMKIAIFALSIIFSWLYFLSALPDLTRVVIHLHYSTWDQAKIMSSQQNAVSLKLQQYLVYIPNVFSEDYFFKRTCLHHFWRKV